VTRRFRRLRTLGPPALAFLAAIAGWDVAVRILHSPPYLLPAPAAVLEAVRADAEVLVGAFAITGAAACGGLMLSLFAGLAAAFVFAEFALLRRALFPYAVFLQTVPIVAIAPLIVIWFGTGLPSVVAVSFLVSAFPIITSGTAGLNDSAPELRELFALHGASRATTFWKLRLPGAIPHIAAGVRVAGGLAVIGAIVGEFFAGFGAERHGLGYLVLVSSSQLRTPLLFATILASTGLGLTFFALTGAVERALTWRWKEAV
jgi:NitT/TauT family transport system permease protein